MKKISKIKLRDNAMKKGVSMIAPDTIFLFKDTQRLEEM